METEWLRTIIYKKIKNNKEIWEVTSLLNQFHSEISKKEENLKLRKKIIRNALLKELLS